MDNRFALFRGRGDQADLSLHLYDENRQYDGLRFAFVAGESKVQTR